MYELTSPWKEKNDEFVDELIAFWDEVENVEDEKLKKNIRMLHCQCDAIVTRLAEEMFLKCYQQGIKDGKAMYKKEKKKHTILVGKNKKEKIQWVKNLLWEQEQALSAECLPQEEDCC